MGGTTGGSSFLSGAIRLLKPNAKKTSKTSARKNGSRVLAKKRSGANGQDQSRSYQAAEIEFDESCACEAVRRIAGQRFLMSNVPTIPVPDCDSPDCSCSYVRYTDRRHWADDRRAGFNLRTDSYGKGDSEDRRKTRDRRVSEESVSKNPGSLDDFEAWFK